MDKLVKIGLVSDKIQELKILLEDYINLHESKKSKISNLENEVENIKSSISLQLDELEKLINEKIMPNIKFKILNKDINLSYESQEKEKLIESTTSINKKLEEYNNLIGKVSDHKILSILAIKLEAELLELKKENNHFLKKIKNKEDVNKENILNKETIYNLKKELRKQEEENEILIKNIDNILTELNLIINLIKQNYE